MVQKDLKIIRTIRLSKIRDIQIQNRAKDENMTPSSFMRKIILDYLDEPNNNTGGDPE